MVASHTCEHSLTYRVVGSPCCIPATIVILCANDTSIKKNLNNKNKGAAPIVKNKKKICFHPTSKLYFAWCLFINCSKRFFRSNTKGISTVLLKLSLPFTFFQVCNFSTFGWDVLLFGGYFILKTFTCIIELTCLKSRKAFKARCLQGSK